MLAAASAVGSLVEQEGLYQDWRPPALYYPERYGEFLGNLYMNLGITHAYSSVWYATLVLLCAVNLIIGSLQWLIPLHRSLTRPQVWKLPHFIRRQQVFYEIEGDLAHVAPKLKQMGFKLVADRECLYGDKGRLSRYGPYIIHIGLLLVAFAAFAKSIPGWDVTEQLTLTDGQTALAPGTNFAIKNNKFTYEQYENGAPKRFVTDASIIYNGEEVRRSDIEVNHPLSFGGWEIYQTSWIEEPGVAAIVVHSAMSKQPVNTVMVDLRAPEPEYLVTDKIKLNVAGYYHDYTIDPETNRPTNATYEIKNPVLLAEFVEVGSDSLLGRAGLPILAKNVTPVYDGPLYLESGPITTRYKTALTLHKDLTLPYLYIGTGTVLFGMAVTFFVFHRQVWVRAENGKVLIGARAYKNPFGLKQEFHFDANTGEAQNPW